MLFRSGWMKWYLDEPQGAISLLNDALALFLVLGDEEGLIWVNIFLADCHRVVGETRLFDEHIAKARHYLSINRLPWGDAGLAFVLGDAALAAGDHDAALEQYRVAVSTAHAVQSIMQTLRHLCGIAEVWWAMGRTTDAVTLCHFLIQHPATWDDTLKRARAILSRAALTDGESEALQAQAVGLSLEAVLHRVGVVL